MFSKFECLRFVFVFCRNDLSYGIGIMETLSSMFLADMLLVLRTSKYHAFSSIGRTGVSMF